MWLAHWAPISTVVLVVGTSGSIRQAKSLFATEPFAAAIQSAPRSNFPNKYESNIFCLNPACRASAPSLEDFPQPSYRSRVGWKTVEVSSLTNDKQLSESSKFGTNMEFPGSGAVKECLCE